MPFALSMWVPELGLYGGVGVDELAARVMLYNLRGALWEIGSSCAF